MSPTRISGSLERFDVVVVGAGPAGLMFSTCLARWGYRILVIDNRHEPTPRGRADGIQPRSLDLLRNMGLKSAIMAHKPARVYEVAFWDARPESEGIARTGTWASCPGYIDARYPFTTLLHQGLIERVFLSDMASNGVHVRRSWTVAAFATDPERDRVYPVEARLRRVDGTGSETVRAKYLFGADGARSFIRGGLGISIRHGDPIEHVWAVLDGVVRTNFPDIKMKCTIHSEHGSMMCIPRENNMVRLYIQIASSTDPDWNPRKTATEAEVQASAKKILQPFSIEWDSVDWCSFYPIGQGIAERYTLDHRVFLGGDACHTHSPKAGQGMNTAFLDALNLAWKIHVVEGGFADRGLLMTYEAERKDVATTLLAFDNKYAKLFSERLPSTAPGAHGHSRPRETGDDTEFIKTFKEACAFTSGYGVAYKPNVLNWSGSHPAQSPLIDPKGCLLRPGRLLINVDVTRVVDANVVHLEQEIPLNGAFRIFVFAGNPALSGQALRDLSRGLLARGSFFSSFRLDPKMVSYHEKYNPHSRFLTFCTVLASPRSAVDIGRDVPQPLARYRDLIYADDRRLGGVGANTVGQAHAKLGLKGGQGAVVVVRPDGYVALVVTLAQGAGTAEALNQYFGAVCARDSTTKFTAQL